MEPFLFSSAGCELKDRIRPLPDPFAALSRCGGVCLPVARIESPAMVSTIRSVGEKIQLALLMGKHDSIGIDCVALCVNDMISAGVLPLSFQDYRSAGPDIPPCWEAVTAGIEEGCRRAGCAYLGSEHSEAHNFCHPAGRYDLAGFAIGAAEEAQLLDGSKLQPGDLLIGLSSSGIHTDGFPLLRKVLNTDDRATLDETIPELGCTLGEELLKPTRIYVRAMRCLLDHHIPLHAACHVRGGLYASLDKMLRPGLAARIHASAFPAQPIFELLASTHKIGLPEMYHTFNMGLGMILAIPRSCVGDAMELLTRAEERAYVIGSVLAGDGGLELV